MVADVLSSDPFVIIKYGETLIGETQILYKNLNPVWPDVFTFGLNEIAGTLSFQVVDYDSNSDNDLMGVAEVSLSEVRDFEVAVQFDKKLQDVKKGHLLFELTIEVRLYYYLYS